MEEQGTGKGWYRVCLNTIVRKDVKLDSERLRILPMGSRVNVIQQAGRRVQIDQPIKGWCSLSSSNGDTILKKIQPSDATATPTAAETKKQVEHNLHEAQKQAQKAGLSDQQKAEYEAKIAYFQKQAKQAQDLLEKKAFEKEVAEKKVVGEFRVGDVVNVKKMGFGFVRFYGEVESEKAKFVGVEFETAIGDTNGYHDGRSYFNVPDGHGQFLPATDCTILSPETIFKKLVATVEKLSTLNTGDE